MFNVVIEMPSGALSQEHIFQNETEADMLFRRFVSQMRPWKGFHADVVLTDDGKVIQLEQIRNA